MLRQMVAANLAVTSFEPAVPTLEEIFVRAVSKRGGPEAPVEALFAS